MELGNLFCVSLCMAPFLVPALVGFGLIIKNLDNDLARMAGLLTLKPILTTPMWIAIALLAFMPAIVPILPGACLTLAAAVGFRSTLSGPRASKARLLLVLDCARWLNSLLLGIDSPGIASFGPRYLIAIPLGLAMPSIFAIVAWQVVKSDAGNRQPL